MQRRLSDKEWLLLHDTPGHVMRAVSDDHLALMVSHVGLPFKSRFHIVRSVSAFLTQMKSVDNDSPTPGSPSGCPRKRASTNDEEDGALGFDSRKRMKLPTVDACSDPREEFDYRREEKRTRRWLKEAEESGLASVVTQPVALPDGTRAILQKVANDNLKRPTSDSPMPKEQETQDQPDRNLKAAKDDDARIPVELWRDKIRKTVPDRCDGLSDDRLELALGTIRKGALRYWNRSVSSSFWRWWKRERLERHTQGLPPRLGGLEPGLLALQHSVDASWWDWDRGSAPFFWRFPQEWQEEARDGLAPRFLGPPPSWKHPQRPSQDPKVRDKEREKISNVRAKGYIATFAGILSLLSFFSVPKGDSDIRMVYDGTKSGLNDVLFAPWFWLPVTNSLLRTVGSGYWMADNDYGEMFLNFWLHRDLRKYCGIDLTQTFPEEKTHGKQVVWEAWSRNAMGLSPSPYASCQIATRLKRLMLGDRSDEQNVFRWDRVVLNLPGSEDYDSSMPWVYKARRDGTLAADIHKYVDDVRITAPTKADAEAASSRVAKYAAYFGTQDAARKSRPSSQTPGAWAGSNIEAEEDAVYKTVSQERWDKTKGHVAQLEEWSESPDIPRKELERIRGFLVYVSLTYTIFAPYLKGIHLTLESWRPDRDDEGWRMTSIPDSLLQEKLGVGEWSNSDKAPERVEQVPRFGDDVRALKAFTDFEVPPRLLARPTKASVIIFIFADASGHGFGTSIWLLGEDTIGIGEGVWNLLYRNKSSNYREMYNIVLKLEEALISNEIPRGAEVFAFTDNQVTERAFYRGTSSSPELFELVLRLRLLEVTYSLFLHIVWVAGTRMIAQGTDGFSRGDLENGVAVGAPMLKFVPLYLCPFGQSPTLESWLRETLPRSDDWLTLDPIGWFELGHGAGHFIWNVPAAAARTALDQLCEAKLARPQSSHLFVVPTVLTPEWRKRLGRIADAVVTVPAAADTLIWPSSCHEPLTIALICPLLLNRPWQIKRCESTQDTVRDVLCGVWRDDCSPQRDCMRELWNDAWFRAGV